MNKLFVATLTSQLVILAEDKDDVREYLSCINLTVGNASETFDVDIEPLTELPDGWNDDCIPYGNNVGDKTIEWWRNHLDDDESHP